MAAERTSGGCMLQAKGGIVLHEGSWSRTWVVCTGRYEGLGGKEKEDEGEECGGREVRMREERR